MSRKAMKSDFRIGARIKDAEGNEFCLRQKYDEGIWECNKRVHYENEARHYTVEDPEPTRQQYQTYVAAKQSAKIRGPFFEDMHYAWRQRQQQAEDEASAIVEQIKKVWS